MTAQDLPHLNALLNATSAVLLVAGWLSVRARRLELHKRLMIAALVTSSLFLLSYVVYHFQVGSVRYRGTGTLRTVYFTVLLTHTVLATAIAVLVPITVVRAWRGQFAQHRKIARWTLPIWTYVSVTGVVVYWMLYRL